MTRIASFQMTAHIFACRNFSTGIRNWNGKPDCTVWRFVFYSSRIWRRLSLRFDLASFLL